MKNDPLAFGFSYFAIMHMVMMDLFKLWQLTNICYIYIYIYIYILALQQDIYLYSWNLLKFH